MQPTIGRIVHYTSFGTPGGEYGTECRAAIVTELTDDPAVIGLAVLNPTGMFFNRATYHDGSGQPGTPDCPDQATHGSPFRYCACGWTEASPAGGTWHWPERA
ncbi:hypothetical protein ACFVFS_05685 [Kitasatospora sp. NPDC057692]|uniref:hypothetical protein n=1 Tax=Kitasatospora sp. NPDC057692 TaxID=3346215 RepID=UPI0036C44F9F